MALLGQDPTWRHLMELVMERGGCDFGQHVLGPSPPKVPTMTAEVEDPDEHVLLECGVKDSM